MIVAFNYKFAKSNLPPNSSKINFNHANVFCSLFALNHRLLCNHVHCILRVAGKRHARTVIDSNFSQLTMLTPDFLPQFHAPSLITNWLIVWIGGLSWRFSLSLSSFCDFFKMTICDFIAFFSFLARANLFIFQMCFIRRTLAYLCLNMINFDAVDFSEHRSEEVIGFFWRSVYKLYFKCPWLQFVVKNRILVGGR